MRKTYSGHSVSNRIKDVVQVAHLSHCKTSKNNRMLVETKIELKQGKVQKLGEQNHNN